MLAALPEARIGRPELHAPRLCRRQGGLGPIADLAGFLLGHVRYDVDRPPVDLLVVKAHEVHLAFEQHPRDRDVAGQPAQVGND